MLADHGYRVTVLPVDGEGRIDLDDLERAFAPDTLLVSVMHANNEIGTVHDIAAIAARCRERGVLCHTDATQTIGRLPFDVGALGVDLASFTGHKMYGPKGAGGLYVRRGCTLLPLFEGGGHERGLRSGTLNVPGHRRPRRGAGAGRRGDAARRRAHAPRCAIGCGRRCARPRRRRA